jgi:hypothetical protein
MFLPMIFGMMSFAVALLSSLALYIFAAYVLYRLGRKFNVGSFLEFLVPIYNIMLVCDCAAVSRWFTLAIVAPVILTTAASSLSLMFAPAAIGLGSQIVSLCANVYLWGHIAERLGKNFWLWGIATPLLFGLPILILAFDDSVPRGWTGGGAKHGSNKNARRDSGGVGRYIDV